MKESIAIAMRHSKREAERTYDRRTSVERKRQALSFAHRQINRFENDEENEDDEEQRSVPEAATPFELGQFVGCVRDASTLAKPKILLGRMLRKDNRGIQLLWYRNLKGRKAKNLYKLCLDGDEWIEKPESLLPVTVAPNGEIDTVLLKTDTKEIHKAVFCD